MENTGRCMKCKKAVTIKDGKEVTMKNTRKMLKGVCPECGTVVCRILGASVHTEQPEKPYGKK